MGDGLVSHSIYLIFLLIMSLLVFRNYPALVAIMKQGGATANTYTKTLQGR